LMVVDERRVIWVSAVMVDGRWVMGDGCEGVLCEVSLLIKLNQNNHERQCVMLHNFCIGVMHVRNSHRGPITYRSEKRFSGLACQCQNVKMSKKWR
jgi:hypothetical protein